MTISSSFRQNSLTVIRLALLFLFVYAAVSKLTGYEKFSVQVGLSPLLPYWVHSVSFLIPVAELVIALLLVFPRTMLTGFYFSFILMMLFTSYVAAILTLARDIPCSCGGVLEIMGWHAHLYFNLFFTLLAFAALLLAPRDPTHKKITTSIHSRL